MVRIILDGNKTPYDDENFNFLDVLVDIGLLKFKKNMNNSMKEMVMERDPFYESVHSTIIESLLTWTINDLKIETIVSELRKFPYFLELDVFPYDTEDALTMWTNVILQKSGIECYANSESEIDEILKDFSSDGRILGIFQYYIPQSQIKKWEKSLTDLSDTELLEFQRYISNVCEEFDIKIPWKAEELIASCSGNRKFTDVNLDKIFGFQDRGGLGKVGGFRKLVVWLFRELFVYRESRRIIHVVSKRNLKDITEKILEDNPEINLNANNNISPSNECLTLEKESKIITNGIQPEVSLEACDCPEVKNLELIQSDNIISLVDANSNQEIENSSPTMNFNSKKIQPTSKENSLNTVSVVDDVNYAGILEVEASHHSINLSYDKVANNTAENLPVLNYEDTKFVHETENCSDLKTNNSLPNECSSKTEIFDCKISDQETQIDCNYNKSENNLAINNLQKKSTRKKKIIKSEIKTDPKNPEETDIKISKSSEQIKNLQPEKNLFTKNEYK
ncbi:hypothetical protein HK096_007805, partial [Nowakowskiella sp. JEL0078]